MMNYFSVIENFPIVKRLNGEYKDKFENLVNYAAPRLEQGPLLSKIGFTPHDFSHHVKDIYLLLDIMLPETFFEKYYMGENLFILLTGALFHDIGMTKEWNEDVRARHSEIGREIFLEPFLKNDVSSVIMQNVEAGFFGYIGDIIYAHSDIKSGDRVIGTFLEIFNKYEQSNHVETGG
jgi:hypothetical protein